VYISPLSGHAPVWALKS